MYVCCDCGGKNLHQFMSALGEFFLLCKVMFIECSLLMVTVPIKLASYPGRRGERAAWYLLHAHAYTIPYTYRKIVRYMYASHVAKLIAYTEYV